MSNVASDWLGQLRQALGNAVFDAGAHLVASGCVQEVRVLQAGKVVTGVTAAEAGVQRRVYVQYQQQPAIKVTGECNCSEVAPCLHVAAVCIAAAEQMNGTAVHERRVPSSASPERHARPASQRLYYCLDQTQDRTGLCLTLWIATPAIDATGQPHSATSFELRTLRAEGRFPRYVGREDEAILQAWVQQEPGGAPLRKSLLEQLPRIVATGRAHWTSLQNRALHAGAPRRLQFVWQLNRDGTQRLALEAPGNVVLLLEVESPLYLDAQASTCGALDNALELRWLREYWGRDVMPEQVPALNQRLPAGLPQLQSVVVETRALRGVRGSLSLHSAPGHELGFLYNDLPVRADLPALQRCVRVLATGAMVHEVVVHEIERDRAAEAKLRVRLERDLAQTASPNPRLAWLTFMLHAVPALQAEGWEVAIAADFPYRIADAADWYTELIPQQLTSPDASPDWFDLRLGVNLGDQSFNLLPALLEYLQSGAVQLPALEVGEAEFVQIDSTLLLRLPDGRFVAVPMARIERIAQTLVELFDRDGLNERQALSLPRTQANRVLLLDTAPVRVRCADDSLARLFQELQASRILPASAPESFHATLRPYQAEGLGWLQFLQRCQLGGILADDMGLGKTLQTLAHLLLDKQRRAAAALRAKPSLIVAPVSVIGNWQQELRRFAPELELVVLHGQRRRESFAAVARADVVLTGYPQLLLDEEFLCSCEFALVVLDEAQMVKNPRTRAAQIARALQAEQRLCLTGTPLENHLGELWSLLDFVQPGLLGDERQFQRWYRTPIERDRNQARATALSRRIAPFLLRRTKAQVASELPEKTQIIEHLVLDERQRDFYDAIRLAMHRRVQETIAEQGLARSQLTILDALLKLRQACCDPRLVDLDLGPDVEPRASVPSAKLQWLSTVLPQLAAEGRRVLLFSQFTSMLSLIEVAVQEAGIDYCLLTGATRERAAQVQRFQSGSVPLFLISLKAGGTGLNLTAADTVIHYDPWWNPAVEAQATDRAHRIGQQQPVFVYKLITQDTVEEKILQLQAHKHALASQLYAEQIPLAQLSAADLAEILGP